MQPIARAVEQLVQDVVARGDETRGEHGDRERRHARPADHRRLVEHREDDAEQHERVLEPVIDPRDLDVRPDRGLRAVDQRRSSRTREAFRAIGRRDSRRCAGPIGVAPTMTQGMPAAAAPAASTSARSPTNSTSPGASLQDRHASRKPRGLGLQRHDLRVAGAEHRREAAAQPQRAQLRLGRVVGEHPRPNAATDRETTTGGRGPWPGTAQDT